MADNYITDGDAGFVKVDTQLPPHELPDGVAADAVNKRCESGQAWPRYGALSQAWGTVAPKTGNVVPGSATYVNFHFTFPINIGQVYRLRLGNHDGSAYNGATLVSVIGNQLPDNSFLFTATQPVLTLVGTIITGSVTATLYYAAQPRAFSRFIDPNGIDSLVLVTDEWRTDGGGDGGRGRAWRILSGNVPVEIPLNGHDVYGEARLVPCFNGLLLLRQDNERHYFQASAVDITNSKITLNTTPAWNDGDLVLFFAFPNSYITGTTPPAPLATYYVQHVAANTVKLYRDAGLTLPIDLTGGTALGSFYLERQAAAPGFFGNGAPPLIMQTDGTGATVWEVGFKAVPKNVFATAFDGTSKVLTAVNHRLIPGDQVTYQHTTSATETFFVSPVSPDGVMLFATQILALGGLLANAQTPSPAFTSGDYIVKGGAGGLPMPPLREGAYLEVNRLVGVNQRNVLPISDPMDPLHFAPQLDTVTASLGEGDQVNAILPMTKDRFIIAKDTRLMQFLGISQAQSAWQLTNLTREFGWIAPLACIQVGKDGWGLSRKGITSVFATEAGEIYGLADPVSRPMKKYIDRIDWNNARQACAATWNNRAYFAVPLKGQTGQVQNNGVLVYNILNQGWEGLWQGAALKVYCFARCVVFGQERLCWVDYLNQVHFFDPDALYDNATSISDLLLTRTYTGKNAESQKSKLWLICLTNWDTYAPNLTIAAQAPGYNESFPMAGGTALQYDKTKYLVNGKADYDPASPGNFNDPDRSDYSQSPGELLAGPIDVHQNISEKWRMRVNDWGVAIQISNAAGSARIQSVVVKAMPTATPASRKT